MSWFTPVAHLAGNECRWLLRPGRLAVAVGPVVVISLINVQGALLEVTRFQGSLIMNASSWLPLAIPLFAGITAGSLAEDRRRGFTLTIFARGLSRSQYFLAKGLGAAASSALVTMAGLATFFLLAWFMLPAGQSSCPPEPDYPGPVPALFQASPLGNDLLSAAMYVTAAAALSLTGVLASAAGANEYIAMLAPLLVALLGLFAPDRLYGQLNPFTYLNLSDAYAPVFPEGQRPYAAFVYWLVFGSCAALLGNWIFARRELA